MLQDGGWGRRGGGAGPSRVQLGMHVSALWSEDEARRQRMNGLIQREPGLNVGDREGDMDMERGRAVLGGHGDGRVRVWGCIVPGLGLCKPRTVH